MVEIRQRPVATNVSIQGQRLIIALSNGGEISFPLTMFPRLVDAKHEDLQNWKLRWGGQAIRWESLDEDVSIPQLLSGQCSWNEAGQSPVTQ